MYNVMCLNFSLTLVTLAVSIVPFYSVSESLNIFKII